MDVARNPISAYGIETNHVTVDFGWAGAGRARVLEPGAGVPQAADRVPDVGTHAGRRLGGRPLAPRDWVPEWGQHQGWSWAAVVHQ